ncbi:MAG: phosphoribosylglycinamide formyltransferase [Ruminococcus sp.]|jgi:phosphoribosylglycinamide formyltransferase-1|nr:phosphoribosylglycinamide formyltransferase [Ruminococcus sp.]
MLIVLVSGGGTNLQALIDSGIKVDYVLSSNPNAYAIKRCENYGIKYSVIQNPEEIDNELSRLNPDLIVLAGYLKILPKDVTEKYRIINIHPSLLPSFGGKGMYGLNVHRAVLAEECKITGATVHYVDGGVDTGRIIAQAEVVVPSGISPENLQQLVMEKCEQILLPKVVKNLLSEIEKNI